MAITKIQNSITLPEPQLRSRAKTWHTLNVTDLEILSMLRKHRRTSVWDLIEEDTTSFNDTYEVLYKITDIVLVICAVIFVISAIASITLWIAGIILNDFVKSLHIKR